MRANFNPLDTPGGEKRFTHPDAPTHCSLQHVHPMKWHYVNQGEAAGPISDEELLWQLRTGTIPPN